MWINWKNIWVAFGIAMMMAEWLFKFPHNLLPPEWWTIIAPKFTDENIQTAAVIFFGTIAASPILWWVVLRVFFTKTKQATQNATIHYTVHHHYAGAQRALIDSPIPSYNDKSNTFIQFATKGVIEILDSNNITSLTDNGVGSYIVNFSTPLDKDTLICHPLGDTPRHFEIIHLTGNSVSLKFSAPEPERIGLKFEDSALKPRVFVSNEENLTADILLVVTHNLGVTPSQVHIMLVCKEAANGYNADEQITISPEQLGMSIAADANDLKVQTGPSQGFLIPHKITGERQLIDHKKWRIKFTASA